MSDREFMHRAVAAAEAVTGDYRAESLGRMRRRLRARSRPGVRGGDGSSRRPARRDHGAGPGRRAPLRGATLFTTLEPCAHHGRTPPCTDAIIAAGVARVVIGIEDPDPQVAGRGVAALRAAGIEVTVGSGAAEVTEQLAPYLKHRTTGAALGRAEDGRHPRRADRRARRHQPVDHRARGPPRRPPPAGPFRRRPGGGGHGAGRRSRADGPVRGAAATRAAAARRARLGAARAPGSTRRSSSPATSATS